jgi:hypothetical protein
MMTFLNISIHTKEEVNSAILASVAFITIKSGMCIHETKIKMAEMVEMVEMVKIILTWTLPKVEMAEIMLYYIILIRYK